MTTRRTLLTGVTAVWLALAWWLFSSATVPWAQAVVVTHWANSHMMRPDLLPAFAERFNRSGAATSSGRAIRVAMVGEGSAEIVDELVGRLGQSGPIDPKLPNPTIVTPSADHWLVGLNHTAGRTVVDLASTRPIARTWIGIATYRDMAECLGWPEKEIGFVDIVALRNDPRGWAAYPCAKAEWGQRPLVAFTDPITSTTGRSVLYTLYAIAAGKPAAELTEADVRSPSARAYVKGFQRAVDHYVVGTLPLNTQIYQGPRYGHFFFVPEDNLVQLYQGTESVQIGAEIKRAPIGRPMVMIYPKEGSTAHNHSAAVVRAPWVDADQREAAERWIDFLHADEQQRVLMAAGFRPATDLPLADPIAPRFGLDPAQPTRALDPDRIAPRAAAAIVADWDEVKKPGVVTFVVDTSASMRGKKLDEARAGLVRAVDGMSARNQVGLVTFADTVTRRVPVGPLVENRFELARAVGELQANGYTALYDAIRAGVEMTDAASGDPDAIRGVVVLTDGLGNRGETRLHDLVRLTSDREVPVQRFDGFEGDGHAVDRDGAAVPKTSLIGTGLALRTRHPILVFFIGVGEADLNVGRLLAEATGASFSGATDKDLAAVLEQFGKYF